MSASWLPRIHAARPDATPPSSHRRPGAETRRWGWAVLSPASWGKVGSRHQEEIARAAVVVWARVRPRRLLYMDDDRFLLESATRGLEEIGARCAMATTHAQAVTALAEDDRIDVAILDFSMPDGDVGGLVSRLRGLRPEVLLIGTSVLDRRQAFRSCGVDRFLAKPWRLEELPRAIGW